MACSRVHMKPTPIERCTYHQMNDNPSPPSSQNLGCCQDLFRYYEKKLEKYEIDYAILDTRLQEYKNVYHDFYQLEMQLTQRDEEIASLQQALGDLQMAYLEEQGKVAYLDLEKKTLKVQEEECRKKLCQLMEQCGDKESHADCGPTHCSRCNELLKENKMLKEQIDLNSRISQQQKQTYEKDREIRNEEVKAAQKRDTHQIRILNNKLKKSQELLHGATDEYLNMRMDFIKCDKKRLVQKEMNYFKDGYVRPCETSERCDRPCTPLTVHQRIHKADESTRAQPRAQSAFVRSTRCCADKCNKVKSREKSKESLQEELMSWKKKFEALEKRRQFEITGFQTDIKLLRTQLNSIEKQLFKLFEAENTKKDDTVFLRVIHQTNVRSKRIFDSVGELKRRIYTLENDLRRL